MDYCTLCGHQSFGEELPCGHAAPPEVQDRIQAVASTQADLIMVSRTIDRHFAMHRPPGQGAACSLDGSEAFASPQNTGHAKSEAADIAIRLAEENLRSIAERIRDHGPSSYEHTGRQGPLQDRCPADWLMQKRALHNDLVELMLRLDNLEGLNAAGRRQRKVCLAQADGIAQQIDARLAPGGPDALPITRPTCGIGSVPEAAAICRAEEDLRHIAAQVKDLAPFSRQHTGQRALRLDHLQPIQLQQVRELHNDLTELMLRLDNLEGLREEHRARRRDCLAQADQLAHRLDRPGAALQSVSCSTPSTNKPRPSAGGLVPLGRPKRTFLKQGTIIATATGSQSAIAAGHHDEDLGGRPAKIRRAQAAPGLPSTSAAQYAPCYTSMLSIRSISSTRSLCRSRSCTCHSPGR